MTILDLHQAVLPTFYNKIAPMLTGATMVQCATLKEFGKLLFHVTVLCTTMYQKHAKQSFEILQEIIEQRPCDNEICKEMVS